MYYKFKNGEYWAWSSEKASLDCLPQYKFKTWFEYFLFKTGSGYENKNR